MERSALKHILSDQQEEAERLRRLPIIPREAAEAAGRWLERDWVLVITGVRRCGKSILAHLILAGRPYAYVNFDDERLIELKTSDLDRLLEVIQEIRPETRFLLFDEIQNIKGWELFVDRLRRKGFRIIVTGSNSRLLSRELASHLTGRTVSLELFPFSFREYLEAKGTSWRKEALDSTETRARMQAHFSEYLETGGFPEMVIGGFSGVYLRELYDRIITRDIAMRRKIREIKTLKEVALYAMSQPGTRQTYQKTARSLEVRSVTTVKNFFEAMEEAYLLFQIPSFSFKVKEILRGPRKIYPIDLGLGHAVSLKSGKDLGAALETFVFQQLRRQQPEIFYFLDNNAEVDFVLRAGRQVARLVQVSLSLEKPETRGRELGALQKAAERTRCNDLMVVTLDEESQLKFGRRKVNVYPAWRWSLTGHG